RSGHTSFSQNRRAFSQNRSSNRASRPGARLRAKAVGLRVLGGDAYAESVHERPAQPCRYDQQRNCDTAQRQLTPTRLLELEMVAGAPEEPDEEQAQDERVERHVLDRRPERRSSPRND